MERFYREVNSRFEHCFYVETSALLTTEEEQALTWLLSETFEPDQFGRDSFFSGSALKVVEFGPRLNFATAFSTNAVAICHACGLRKVTRLERARRHVLFTEDIEKEFIVANHDRMTECLYSEPLKTFATGIVPQPVRIIPLLEEGSEALRKLNRQMGLGMDEWDIEFDTKLFVEVSRRNPTDVECFHLGQANSEHSRHGFFKGRMVIDGVEMPESLMDVVKSTLLANPSNSVLAFCDNSSGIKGFRIRTIMPVKPGQCAPFREKQCVYHVIFTAETHNFPSGVAPFPGAETGTGGRIRDVQATGRGALVIAGTAGFCTASLHIPGYLIPGEDPSDVYPANLATPLKIMLEESAGAWDYGNKFGEPVIQGFVRTFDQRLPDEERRAWIKPIMFTGGVGQIDARHVKKGKPEKGMLIVQIGGPAYRIGIGGGAASSQVSGDNTAELDFNAVQRGDAEMEQKMNRVGRACVEMGDKNPMISKHDQGAGGPCNVLTELVYPAGGRVEIRNIMLGDQTMSVLEIWGAEYQERNALLIWPERLEEFQAICLREKVNCEVLGEITGDGRIVVHDAQDDSTPVDLDLSRILGKVPQKVFHSEHLVHKREPLRLPAELDVCKALQMVFKLPSVGSKEWLAHHVDRSVTGLIARQQCCGPRQLPVSDVAVVAQGHFGYTGAATAIGEQPIKMLVDPKAGARMAVGEALTNMVWARVSDLEDIKCSGNWMWAAKLPGEGALLYDAAVAMRDLMAKPGTAIDGGKDSLSMAAKVGDEIVKAPGELVISAYAAIPDIRKVVTPDIKQPGKSKLMLIDLALGKNRLGGSALAQAFGQIGDEVPDVEDPELLKRAFNLVQQMIEKDLILAGHDRSDGGLATTIIEMALAGNCGLEIQLDKNSDLIPYLFSEELGLVIEYLPEYEALISPFLEKKGIPFTVLGKTRKEQLVTFKHGTCCVMERPLSDLIEWWQATSDALEQLQINPEMAKEQQRQSRRCTSPSYRLTFEPDITPSEILCRETKPRVAVIREEGSNGDREMTSAFYQAGFEPWDVTMTDLLRGEITLAGFRGVAFVGGFSYGDVLDSAKGWAGIIRGNEKLREMFDAFYQRPDTFSLGVCNGCQLMALLGWVPWKGIPVTEQPRFIRNPSGKFESRWTTVKICLSPAIMLQGMEGSVLGIWVAHGEGRLYFPQSETFRMACDKGLAPMVYVNEEGISTERYPLNPNGSPLGITALCSPDGRHLAMMPHPERAFLLWQWPWMQEEWRKNLKTSPWLRMFQNAREWCEKTK